VRAVHDPVDLDGVQISPRISVGVTVVGPGPAAPTLPTLLSQADIAMYAAKRGGKGRTVVYHGGMTLPESADVLLSEPLRQALASGHVHPHFQPIVELGTGRIRGFEALARWQHRGQWVPATELVALANRTGQMAALTATMLDQACATLAQVGRDTGQKELFVTVNVSPSHVVDPTFPAQVRAAVQRHGLAPRDLVIEITEEGLLGDLAATRAVTSQLHADGFALALDDFGTGYSSLAHLHEIPLSILKIDRAFVVRLGQDARSEIFLQAVRHLGEDLGLSVMVEGVETEQQALILEALGIELAQGFHFAPALPPAELTALAAAGGASCLVALASPPRP
jgi:EAL domain-containing protein (putative c-di-GMP-specific phosphodiesterase class I)